MCVKHRNLTWTLALLFLSGALCIKMNVTYQLGHICAVKGSSVVIPCSYDYPKEHKVEEVLWGHEKYHIYDGPFLFDSAMKNTTSRFQFIGDKEHNCSFLIHQIENNDTGKYAFRFITDKDKFTGKYGPTLKVVDLNISLAKLNGSRSFKEGDSVNMTCTNSCDGGHRSSIFTWLKNGEPIHEGPVLYVSNISSTNTGNYTCSLKTQRATTSEVINIDVEYGPRNTSVSIIPLKEVDGSYFKCICTSNANPPVENYTWFKIDENDHLIVVGNQSVISVSDGGQYLCSATNKHGSQNSTVIVKFKEPFNRGLLLIPTVAVLLIVTTVIAITREQQVDSHHDDGGVIYSTVCSYYKKPKLNVYLGLLSTQRTEDINQQRL
ncbi:B-cell receptor CD22 B-lymphocyte cell adhesion molecule [Collichthys lucidus]|uniref:B-cell receptor CD22 B-lymphocyte cell adhesion molecule n=1 Tax=Collichthys lucidus TaxID=240159 RepID=A0A4U5VWX6_COLLU|nr:B-cell receptor CD22 B-lymphocyte cell adhesion molecule [Collichthys lucidus]